MKPGAIQYEFPNGVLVAKDMRLLQEKFHELRRYRNRLLHSAYEPLKAGDEILGYLRIDPIVAVEKETGNVIHEVEPLSSDAIYAKLREYSEPMYVLSRAYLQLLEWNPFDRFPTTI
jgi:hypothetical protein